MIKPFATELITSLLQALSNSDPVFIRDVATNTPIQVSTRTVVK